MDLPGVDSHLGAIITQERASKEQGHGAHRDQLQH